MAKLSKLDRARARARALRERLDEGTTMAPVYGGVGGYVAGLADNKIDASLKLGDFEVKPSHGVALVLTGYAITQRDERAASAAAGALGAVAYNIANPRS